MLGNFQFGLLLTLVSTQLHLLLCSRELTGNFADSAVTRLCLTHCAEERQEKSQLCVHDVDIEPHRTIEYWLALRVENSIFFSLE